MQNYQNNFIGVDVSKESFDATLMTEKDQKKSEPLSGKFENSKEGLKTFRSWLKAKKVEFNDQTLLVMENTGIYHRAIQFFCTTEAIPFHIGNAAHMKWSFGIARGKNDKIDSLRICKYAYKEAEELASTPKFEAILFELRDLMTLRRKLIDQKNSLQVQLKELRGVNQKSVQKELESCCSKTMNSFEVSVKKTESKIKEKIKSNEQVNKNFKLLISIPGIGEWTAIMLIVCTSNFIFEPSGKQLACYAGVAPFEHTSGTSVKGKTKVHKMGNKELKANLYMCALSTLQNYEEFKTYYDRKISEGKQHNMVMNAIMNKLLLRAASVVKKGESYVDNYSVLKKKIKEEMLG